MSVRLSVVPLEDRSTPATFTVNAVTDTGAGSGNAGDLRYCLAQANANNGDDTIVFDATAFASPQTITLSGTQLSITDSTGKTTINGSAAGVTISGNNASRVFEILAASDISNLTLTGGWAATGGALLNFGALNLANCTISGNASAGFGGGISNYAATTFTNCTIAGNSAGTGGGGIYNGAASPLALVHCTISGNSALTGGGLIDAGGATLTNTIVAQNTGGANGDILGSVNVASRFNLVGTGGSGGLTDGANGNIVGVPNPGLSALGSFGGPVQTVALLPGSPAINAGNGDAFMAADARGKLRGILPDIGAFESQGFVLTIVSGNNQSTYANQPFSVSLVVSVTANNPIEPVDGGTIAFTPPSSGASATISVNPAAIAGGFASTQATANLQVGTYSVSATAGGVAAVPFTLTNLDPSLFAVGARSGGASHVRAFDSGGVERFSFYAYGPDFSGGVHVATGDVNGDGVEDIVTGAGAGGGPHVKVFDGVTGAEIASFFAYDAAGRLGVYVAAVDLDGDGIAEIVTGAGAGGGPHVKAFRFADLAEITSFFAFDPTSRSGVTVSGQPGFIVAGTGAGDAAEVRAFRLADLSQLVAFFPFGAEFRGGVSLAAGNGLVAVGAGPGGSPTASVFTLEGQPVASFDPFDPAFTGGVSVAALGGANSQLVAGAGPGGTPHVRTFDVTGTETASFLAFDEAFGGGIFVG